MGHVRFTPDSDRESGFPRKVMSALPPKADMCGATTDVRFGPIADSCTTANSLLFDYCVDARKDLRGNVEAKRFRRFHINHELDSPAQADQPASRP
jgi:hypothetical protein